MLPMPQALPCCLAFRPTQRCVSRACLACTTAGPLLALQPLCVHMQPHRVLAAMVRAAMHRGMNKAVTSQGCNASALPRLRQHAAPTHGPCLKALQQTCMWSSLHALRPLPRHHVVLRRGLGMEGQPPPQNDADPARELADTAALDQLIDLLMSAGSQQQA